MGNILLTSLQDGLTDRDMIDLQTGLLDMIGETGAEGAVIDVSALEVVDSYVVQTLRETVKMSRMLGCITAVSGIRPVIALALVEIGQEITDFPTALDVDRAVRLVRSMIGDDDCTIDGEASDDPAAIDEPAIGADKEPGDEAVDAND